MDNGRTRIRPVDGAGMPLMGEDVEFKITSFLLTLSTTLLLVRRQVITDWPFFSILISIYNFFIFQTLNNYQEFTVGA